MSMQSLDLAEARIQFADALLQIRRELGMDCYGLSAKELMHLILTEPHEKPSEARGSIFNDLQPRISLSTNS
jgi:hypothetical protein